MGIRMRIGSIRLSMMLILGVILVREVGVDGSC
jgi:hypothetical protein